MFSQRDVIRTLAFSVALSLLLSLGNSVLFGRSVSVDPALDWEKANSMPYAEATAYIEAYSKPISRWETLTLLVQSVAFITPQLFALVGALFVGGLTLVWWTRK